MRRASRPDRLVGSLSIGALASHTSTEYRNPRKNLTRAVGVVTVVVAMAFTLVTPIAPAMAAAQPQSCVAGTTECTLTEITTGLRAWANAFGGLSEHPLVAAPLPLSDVAVRDVLNLDRVVQWNLEAVLLDEDDPESPEDLAAFKALIDSADGFENVEVSEDPSTTVDLSFDLDLTGSIPFPLNYRDENLRLRGGKVDGGLTGSLTGSFTFQYDPHEPLPDLRFVQIDPINPPAGEGDTPLFGTPIVLTVTSSSVASAMGTDGFVDVELNGDYSVNWDTTFRMRDPNGRGRLAKEDFLYIHPADLFKELEKPSPDEVSMELTMTVPDIEGGDLSATITGSLDSAGLPQTTIQRSENLALLSGLHPSAGFLSFAQTVSALLAAQATIDVDLPLLDADMSDLYGPASDLAELLTEMGRAEFACGATDTLPPVGRPAPGGDWYCNARTNVDVTGIPDWSTSDGMIENEIVGTVGLEPTKNVRITTRPCSRGCR